MPEKNLEIKRERENAGEKSRNQEKEIERMTEKKF